MQIERNKMENKKQEEIKEEVKEEEIPQEETDDEEELVEDLVDERDEKIKSLEAQVADLKNKYAMAYADSENTRKRLNAEAEQIKKYRIQSFALEILPVLDNLERALAQDENKQDNGFYTGVKMIYEQLLSALVKEGVTEVICLNEKFDPNFEHAIMVEKKEGVEPGIVIEVLQKGYKLKDRVLRAAMVKVSE
ncbi:MAG: nucleotide exchange factor GrpE [Erysipelotrichaceae bacterium]